jgi:hypothetical protein
MANNAILKPEVTDRAIYTIKTPGSSSMVVLFVLSAYATSCCFTLSIYEYYAN